MEYKEKYEQAIERLKQWDREHSCGGYVLSDRDKFIFPELAESEDEKVRIALIRFHKSTIDIDGIKGADIIAWLEKQGEQEKDILDNAILDGNEDGLIAQTIRYKNEKQNEQKPVDRVEPKFHEGDFIKHNKANIICKVISVNSGSYYVENIETNGRIELFNAEQNFHLWSIQDVKDGDVLISKYGSIGIFKDNKRCYCYIDTEHKHFYAKNNRWFSTDYTLKPATKEQRDLLFQKMKEAGYMWDSDSKQLLPLKAEPSGEQKPAWSEDDMKIALRTEYEKGRADVIAEMQGEWSEEEIEKAAQEWDSKANFNPFYMTMEGNKPTGVKQSITTHEESFKAGVNWILKSLKGRVQPKQEWSDEDEKILEIITSVLQVNFEPTERFSGYEEYMNVDLINWLKSLRPQNRWKPSDEQMKALNYVVNLMASSESPKENDYYYNVFKDLRKQLKKLKEG